jgi:MFS superfamily sulfate permease-like transporter
MARTSRTQADEHPVRLKGGRRQRVEYTTHDLCAGRCGIRVTLRDTPAVPLAYAPLAGLPPHLGLYAAFVPTVIAALCGSSAQLSTGPVALTALLTAASLSALAQPGSPAWVALGGVAVAPDEHDARAGPVECAS